MLKILHVLPSDPGAVTGGLEIHALGLARALKERGLEILIVAPGKAAKMGGEIYRAPTGFARMGYAYRGGQPLHPPWPDLRFARELADLVDQYNPHVVHSHGNAFHSVGLALRGRSVRWVHTLHDYGLICPKATLWRTPERVVCSTPMTASCLPCYLAESRLSPKGSIVKASIRGFALVAGAGMARLRRGRQPDRFIAVSNYVREVHERHLPETRGRIQVIYNWAVEERDQVSPPPPLPERFALFVGSASIHKGLPFLLEIWRRMPQGMPLVAFVTGPLSLVQQMRRLGGPQVHIFHNVPHAAVVAAWQQAFMGVIPSTWPEPSPLVAQEAMRAGCPVVASAVGALPEVIGDAGLLAPPGDGVVWQRQLQALMSDDELRARMALLGRHRAMRLFSPEGAVEAIIGLYHTVLEEHATMSTTVQPRRGDHPL